MLDWVISLKFFWSMPSFSNIYMIFCCCSYFRSIRLLQILVFPMSSQIMVFPRFYISSFTYCLYFSTPEWLGFLLLIEKYLCNLLLRVISNIFTSFWKIFYSSELEKMGYISPFFILVKNLCLIASKFSLIINEN
jgi:hypothetical protein